MSLLAPADADLGNLFGQRLPVPGKDLIDKHLAQCRQDKEAETVRLKEVLDTLEHHAKEVTSGTLSHSRTLRSLGKWAVLPSNCDRIALIYDAESVCRNSDTDVSLSALSAKWQARHESIAKQETSKVRIASEAVCWQQGCCTCRRRFGGGVPAAKVFWKQAKEVIQLTFQDKTKMKLLQDAEMFLVWVGREKDEVKELIVTFVCLMYLRPFRPTLLRMELPSDRDRERLCQMMIEEKGEKNFFEHPSREDLITLKVSVSDNRPALETIMVFCSKLNMKFDWSLAMLRISHRQAPFPNSPGLVRAWLVKPPTFFWRGLDDLPEGPEPPPDGVAQRSGRADHGADADATEGSEDEGGDGGSDAELANLFKSFGGDADDCGGESSSSSSSSTSSSLSHQPRDEQGLSSETQSRVPQPSAASSEVHGDEAERLTPKMNKRDADEACEDDDRRSVKRGRNHEQFGPHFITPRYVQGELISLQMTCRNPHHQSCSKEMTISVAGRVGACRQVLKAWVLFGAGVADRSSHMGPKLKTKLLQALKARELMTEEELDKLVEIDSVELTPPFVQEPAVVGDGSLGTPGRGVSQELHRQMQNMADAGQLTPTSLDQRERNRALQILSTVFQRSYRKRCVLVTFRRTFPLHRGWFGEIGHLSGSFCQEEDELLEATSAACLQKKKGCKLISLPEIAESHGKPVNVKSIFWNVGSQC